MSTPQPPAGPPPGPYGPPAPAKPRSATLLVVVLAVLVLLVAGLAVVATFVTGGDDSPQGGKGAVTGGTDDGDGDESGNDGDDSGDDDSGDDEDGDDEGDEPVADWPGDEWFEGTGRLKVGPNRMVNPCRVLPLSVVEEIYGEFPDDRYVREETGHRNVSAHGVSTGSYDTSCLYEDVVALNASQTTDRQAESRVFGDVFLLPEEVKPRLKRFRKAADAVDLPEVTELVDALEESGKAYLRYRRTYDGAVLEQLDPSTAVFPSGFGMFEFTLVEGTVTYDLDMWVPSGSEETFTPEETGILLQRVAQTVAAVRERAADPEVTAAPVPTLMGDESGVGDTPFVEPCALLSPEVFEKVVGAAENKPASRYLLPKTPRTYTATDSRASSASCERSRLWPSIDSTTVSVDISYAPSQAVLRKSLNSVGKANSLLHLD
ncbi:MAG: hypothetical protein ACI379_01715, partial [Nocardioides sp.]|uniref:hypothetical protein n=1 Tax=Nocardioides sp. TaxID=35761 RepID=UPI003F072D24